MEAIDDEKARQEIANTCSLLLKEEMDFIEGCRKLVSLRNRLGLETDPLFSPFVGVTSETDDYPEKESRHLFSEGYRNRIDKEVSEYILQLRPEISECCRKLLAKYSGGMGPQ